MWHYTIPTPRPNAADTSSTPRSNAADTTSTPRSDAADHIFRMNTILAVFMTAATLLLYYEPA
ncbi:unnamed protein product [Anisakis simplex]|uniref:C-type cytochrome biogenesis protein CcsB n=1 Tax=Anisakis simplex TaxID=6269 RepID=A0A0M3JDU7_ANISI|nr:unnamed protein product [Anisakis simplex]